MDEHTMQCQECGTIHRIYNVCPVCEHRARSKQYSFDDCDWDKLLVTTSHEHQPSSPLNIEHAAKLLSELQERNLNALRDLFVGLRIDVDDSMSPRDYRIVVGRELWNQLKDMKS